MKKIYFPSLNGIRFIAAFMVIVAHVSPYAIERGFTASFFTIDYGALGVTVFFVLSGFLITYLLFHEKQETQTIHVKQFIIRRILRIWPAYFLAVGVGFFLFAPFHEGTRIFLEQHFWLKFSFFALFLANVVRSVIFDAGVMSHLWSVCVEEQFYLAWPFLMKQFSHRFLTMAGSIIGGILLLRIVFAYWNIYYPLGETNHTSWMLVESAGKFLTWSRVDCMAIGGIGAWLLIHKKTGITRILFHPVFQILCYLLMLLFIISRVDLGFLHHDVFGLLSLVLIMNVSSNPKSLLSFENRVMHSLGKISYGLYLYHPFVYLLLIYFLPALPPMPPAAMVTVCFAGVVLGSIAVSWLSYHYFERFFLGLKKRFTYILSGDDAGA